MYHIVYFLDYGQSFGGAANTLVQQAILMKKAGQEVTIYVSNYYGTDICKKYMDLCVKNEITLLQENYQVSSQPEDIDIICLDKNYERIRDIVKELHPDILHSIQINSTIELISRELGIPHIMNIYPLKSDFFDVSYMDVFPHYHICDSWYWAKKWQHYLGTDSTCIRTVVNHQIHRKNVDSGWHKNRYICVGSVYREKNQLSVIRAFHRALSAGVDGELFIYGYANGDYAEQCKQYIDDNHLNRNIQIKGFYENMQVEYEKSDALICGSIRESFPNVISEAMANGVVVISTPVAGVPEVINDHVNGYLASDYTEEAIYKKILEFEQDKKSQRYKNIVENAYVTFSEIHSPKVITEQLLNYYQYVIADKYQRSDVTIGDIRKCFMKWITCFKNSYGFFTKPRDISLKLWYLYHIRERLEMAHNKGFSFYIWGTGNYGIIVKEMVEKFFPQILLHGFVDSYKSGSFLSYPIYDSNIILEKEDVIILVAIVNGQDEIIQKLQEYHKYMHKDYFILAPRRW